MDTRCDDACELELDSNSPKPTFILFVYGQKNRYIGIGATPSSLMHHWAVSDIGQIQEIQDSAGNSGDPHITG